MALSRKLQSRQISPGGMNIFTVGPHARRTHMVYARLFSKQAQVGVISHSNQTYDAQHWWKSSAGFKAVLGEALSLAYQWLFLKFSPAARLEQFHGNTDDEKTNEPRETTFHLAEACLVCPDRGRVSAGGV